MANPPTAHPVTTVLPVQRAEADRAKWLVAPCRIEISPEELDPIQ
jgi:hypothetical protein